MSRVSRMEILVNKVKQRGSEAVSLTLRHNSQIQPRIHLQLARLAMLVSSQSAFGVSVPVSVSVSATVPGIEALGHWCGYYYGVACNCLLPLFARGYVHIHACVCDAPRHLVCMYACIRGVLSKGVFALVSYWDFPSFAIPNTRPPLPPIPSTVPGAEVRKAFCSSPRKRDCESIRFKYITLSHGHNHNRANKSASDCYITESFLL